MSSRATGTPALFYVGAVAHTLHRQATPLASSGILSSASDEISISKHQQESRPSTASHPFGSPQSGHTAGSTDSFSMVARYGKGW